MRRILALTALPVLLVPALAGCVFARGPVVSEDRSVDGAHAVVLGSSGDLVITTGEPALRITAPSAVLDRLTSEVDGDGVLHLDLRGGFGAPWGDIRYELSLPTVDGVTVEGAGDVTVDFSGATDVSVVIDGSGDIDGSAIDAASVVASIDGSGDIELAGSTDSLEARIGGTGDLDLDGLEAADARATIEGAGDIRLRATGTLAAEVSGAGSIRYSGGAELVESRIDGIGDIEAD